MCTLALLHRHDHVEPLDPPSLKLPAKPKPPPSAKRLRELEERELREQEQEEEKQQEEVQQRGKWRLQQLEQGQQEGQQEGDRQDFREQVWTCRQRVKRVTCDPGNLGVCVDLPILYQLKKIGKNAKLNDNLRLQFCSSSCHLLHALELPFFRALLHRTLAAMN